LLLPVCPAVAIVEKVVLTSVTMPGVKVARSVQTRAWRPTIGRSSMSRVAMVRPGEVFEGSNSGCSVAMTATELA
jgi:hypothetical protein